MFNLEWLVIAAILLATYLPAAVLPPSGTAARPRREDWALSLSVVLVGLAVLATFFSGYLVFVIPPVVSFCLAAFVGGLVGRRPVFFGLWAAAVYVLVIGTWLAGNAGANPAGAARFAAIPLASGLMGSLSVHGVWRIRERLAGRR